MRSEVVASRTGSPNGGTLVDADVNRQCDVVRFKTGDRIVLAGEPYKLFVIGDEHTKLVLPGGMPAAEQRQWELVRDRLVQCCVPVQAIADRLLDPSDGLTLNAAQVLMANSARFEPGHREELAAFLFALLKSGSNLHDARSCVVPPPVPRAMLEVELAKLAPQTRSELPFDAWLDHLYNPVPAVTQGYFLFASKGDRERFELSLGAAYAADVQVVAALFERATTGEVLSRTEWETYDHTSQRLMEAQKQRLEPALATDVDASAMSTRVRISVSNEGGLTLRTTHLLDEFPDELRELRAGLNRAIAELPAHATELRGVLEVQADWCVTTDRNPNWGQSALQWAKATDHSNVIDVNLCAEEKASHLGNKGNFQMVICQFDQVPAALTPVWDAVQQSAAADSINLAMLRMLAVGGSAAHMVFLGEKLPDLGGEPAYKSMTFRNTTELLMTDALAGVMSIALGLTDAQFRALHDIPVLGVTLHEFGHTLGDHSDFLGVHSGSVEETNAQASVLYLTKLYAPESLDGAVKFEACWMPIRRVRQGPTEQHSRSDIALVEEYLKGGAVEIKKTATGEILTPRDLDRAVTIAFDTALKMRLWEKGLPTRLHADVMEKFDPTDKVQDRRIMKRGVELVATLTDPEGARKEIQDEANAYFANERLIAIGKQLDGVIAGLPKEQPFTMMPTNHRIRPMLA